MQETKELTGKEAEEVEREMIKQRKLGKFVIKATNLSSCRIKGNPFRTPFPRVVETCAYAILDSFVVDDLSQLKEFAAETLGCRVEDVQIEVFRPLKEGELPDVYPF